MADYSYRRYHEHEGKITCSVQGWNDSFLPWNDWEATMHFVGVVQEDDTVFWMQDNGDMVSTGMENYLNKVRRHVLMKHKLKKA